MVFHPKSLKSENNNPWFQPWFNILLQTQLIVSTIVDSQCLEYLGYITLDCSYFCQCSGYRRRIAPILIRFERRERFQSFPPIILGLKISKSFLQATPYNFLLCSMNDNWRSSYFFSTVNSWFKKVHLFFLKSRVVWLKKGLCSESKIWLSNKMLYVGEFATWDLS